MAIENSQNKYMCTHVEIFMQNVSFKYFNPLLTEHIKVENK